MKRGATAGEQAAIALGLMCFVAAILSAAANHPYVGLGLALAGIALVIRYVPSGRGNGP